MAVVTVEATLYTLDDLARAAIFLVWEVRVGLPSRYVVPGLSLDFPVIDFESVWQDEIPYEDR